MDLDADSLERIVPDAVREGDTTGADSLRIHLERYEFAALHVRPGRVLDMACGAGYGTRLLCDRGGDRVRGLGVDLSPTAVEYARRSYGNERTEFVAADAMDFGDPDGFETVVSIETIEHLPDPDGFVTAIVGLVRPGGVLVASVPVTPSVDANPHHLHDFTPGSFRRLFTRRGLVESESLWQDQPFHPLAVMTRSEARMEQVRSNLPAYYLAHPVSLFRRIASTLRHGFKNRYLTIAWQVPP